MSEANRCPQCGCELPVESGGGLCPACLLEAGLDTQFAIPAAPVENAASPDQAVAQTTPWPAGFDAPLIEDLAPLFPQLEILEPLGRGGMGAVYKAKQAKLDRLVALKIIRPESADDPAFAERFMREARTLARLNHASIVGVYDFGEVEMQGHREDAPRTLYYFVMEFVDGLNLRQAIEAQQLDPAEALAIVPQVCEALQFAHDEGVVHRDIKPENILLDSKGRVKIADFGLAKLAEPTPENFTLTATHQVMGTPRYMAPEQMEGSHSVDHRADIYSLGVVFYEMLTGEVPAGHFDPPSKKVAVDVRLDEVVLRSLAREPSRRYQQASEVKLDVESISHSDAQIQESRDRAGTADGSVEAASRGNDDERTRRLFRVIAVAGGFIVAVTWASLFGYDYTRQLANRYGPATYSFRDGTPRGMGYPLEPRSKAYRHIHVEATGSGRTQGTQPRLETWERQKLTCRLVPNDGPPIQEGVTSPQLFAAGRIEIDLVNGTAFRYRDADANEVSGRKLTEEAVLQWMKSIGVDTGIPGVKLEAAWIYDTAVYLQPGKSKYKVIGKLVNDVAFRGFGVDSSWEVELDPWVERAVSDVWTVLWLLWAGAIVLSVRRRSAGESRVDSAPDSDDPSPRFSGLAVVGAGMLCCGLSIALFIGVILTRSTRSIEGSQAMSGILAMACVACFVLCAAAGVIGAISLARIRNSKGTLTGLGLAFVDMVGLPVLVLNSAIYGVSLLLIFELSGIADEIRPHYWSRAALFSLPVWIVADIALLRWLWKRVTIGVTGVEQIEPRAKARPAETSDGDEPSAKGSVLTTLVVLGLMIGLLIGGSYLISVAMKVD